MEIPDSLPKVILTHGECLAEMAEMPDNYVDLVLCDLPYGTTACKWDAVIPFERLWAEYRRVAKGTIALTSSQPFTSALVMSNPRAFRYQWVWCKNTATGFMNAKRMPLKGHEDVCIFWEGAQTLYHPQMVERTDEEMKRLSKGSKGGKVMGAESVYGAFVSGGQCREQLRWKNPNTKLFIDAVNGRNKALAGLHPTQKPVALMEYMIKTYTNPGMTVLDNCMGSGTTGVACVNLGRGFVGIEQDAAYFKIASERIEAAKKAQVKA